MTWRDESLYMASGCAETSQRPQEYLSSNGVYLLSVFVGVLQGNNQWDVCVYKEIHYKESAHAIIEADKSQGLQSRSWRPRELIVWFQSEGQQS